MLLLPAGTKNKAGAQFIPGACLEAVAFLGLKKNVVVKWAAGTRRRGCYRFRNDTHVITISTYYPAEHISRTMWHELCHAAQVEKAGSFEAFIESPDRYSGPRGSRQGHENYKASKVEVEARQMSELHDTHPLAR